MKTSRISSYAGANIPKDASHDEVKQENEEKHPYRRGVGIVLLNRTGYVFVAQRIDVVKEAWQLPQGGIDKNEDPETAAFRELAEEIGTDQAEVIAKSRGWLHYDLPEDLAGKAWRGRYRGQEQRWFLMRFLGNDADINLNTDPPEFSAWRWVAFEELPRLIVPFKRALYEQIVEEFRATIQDIFKS